MKSDIKQMSDEGSAVHEMIEENDRTYERLEKWPISHMRDIQESGFETGIIEQWLAPLKVKKQQYHFQLLQEVGETCYIPLCLSVDRILQLLRDTSSNLEEAQYYIRASIVQLATNYNTPR
jgi:hypothetical protein